MYLFHHLTFNACLKFYIITFELYIILFRNIGKLFCLKLFHWNLRFVKIIMIGIWIIYHQLIRNISMNKLFWCVFRFNWFYHAKMLVLHLLQCICFLIIFCEVNEWTRSTFYKYGRYNVMRFHCVRLWMSTLECYKTTRFGML